MPDNEVQSAPATGTSADTPLKAPVSESLGSSIDAKLNSLLKSVMAPEPPKQETAKPAETAPAEEEKPAEEQSEETPAEAEATEDTNDLSQEQAEEAENSEPEQAPEENDLPKGVKKKLSKLSAAKRELEEKLAALENEVTALKSKPADQPEQAVAPIPSNPYLHLDTQAKVEAELAQARKVRRWCEENPDGATYRDPATGKETEYTSEQVRNIKLNALEAIEEHLPKQLAYVQQRAQFDPIAESTYNWWKDRTSREYQIAQNMLNNFPEIRKFPDYKIVIGDYIRGAADREATYAKQKAATSAKPVVKKAPAQPTKPSSIPAQVKPEVAKAQQADQMMRKNPNQNALKQVLLSKFL